MVDEEACNCWGCRSPKFLRKTCMAQLLSDIHALYYSVPVIYKHALGGWFVFRDAPTNTVGLWASCDLDETAPDCFNQLVQQAREELKARDMQHARK